MDECLVIKSSYVNGAITPREKNFNDGKIHYYIPVDQFKELSENPKFVFVDDNTLTNGRNRLWHKGS